MECKFNENFKNYLYIYTIKKKLGLSVLVNEISSHLMFNST